MLHTVVAIAGALAAAANNAAQQELTAAKAIVLGLVEGITEFLPVSSTGHLIVTQRLIDVGREEATKDAADTYAITIQAGAILAVVVLYWRRLLTMGRGVVGRDDAGRQLTGVILVAFAPAALIGVVFEDTIKDRLFGVWPVIVAWAVGGIVILAFARWVRARGLASGAPLEAMTWRTGVVIGLAQSLALWPGTSRSLVTIIAALALGFSMHASVEFSFLLGLVTLTAATAYDALRHGSEMFDLYGLASPLLGFVVAFVAAVLAIRWMVGYLERHGLELFGWYRLVIAAVGVILLATGVL